MTYPLFHSIANCIQKELKNRNIKTELFKKWKENTINAAGLEIEINIQELSDFVKKIKINFDWDLFRELTLAKQLNGMEKHPLLQKKNREIHLLTPCVDIEVMWEFDEKETQMIVPSKIGTKRLDAASRWMEQVSKNVNELLVSENIITRWHFEVEGDEHGRYLSTINLLSYFQYSFEGLKHLNEVHNYVSRRMQHLLYKIRKVSRVADTTIKEIAA